MTDATISDFYEALKPWGHSAFSCNGVNLFGDRTSIKTAVEWEHRAHQADYFQQLLMAEKARADEATRLLKVWHDHEVTQLRYYPSRGQSRQNYEDTCKVLGLEPARPGTPIPTMAQVRYFISESSDTTNCRRIHYINGVQVCKVYAETSEAAQARAEKIVEALEKVNVAV